uniref:PGG domain-containing protein n=1 Tax=Quercus lobata TaxID=97700 RepID=A0A7N2MRR7_QUELO
MTQFTDIGCTFKRNRPKEFRRFFRDDIKFERKTNYILEVDQVSKGHRERFVFVMENASQVHLVVDTLIATDFCSRVFVITDTIAMVQSCCAAFIYLFMPLLIREQNLGGFTFLLALLAFCLTILAMGATLLAFVAGTYAVLMHSSDLAIATCVIGLCFFIPGLFISIGCSSYLGEIWGMESLLPLGKAKVS